MSRGRTGTVFWSVRSKFRVRMAGVILTTRTPKGTRTVSGVRWMIRSPSPDPARLIWAEISPGPRAWMIPGDARRRTSTLFTGSPVSSRLWGKFCSSTGTLSPRSEVFSPAITNQSTMATARLASLRGRFSRRRLMAAASFLAGRHRLAGEGLRAGPVLPFEGFEQRLLDLVSVELAADEAVLHERDDAGLFGHHHRHRVRVFRQADGRPVPAAQGARELAVDGEGKEAGRGGHPIGLDDHGPVVERGLGVEDADQQVVVEDGIEGDAGLDVAPEPHVALDDDDGPGLGGSEGGGGQHHLVDRLFLAPPHHSQEGKRRLAEMGEHLSDLRLEDDDDPEDQEGEESAEEPVDGLQVGEQGGPVEHHQDERAQRHLDGMGPSEEQQELVDDEGDEQDVEDVPPGEVRGGEVAGDAVQDHRSPPRPAERMASQTRTTRAISATSWTRTRWAP